MRYYDDPARDADRYFMDLEEAQESQRRHRVIKAQATVWIEVEHATEEEAIREAEELFDCMMADCDYDIEESREVNE